MRPLTCHDVRLLAALLNPAAEIRLRDTGLILEAQGGVHRLAESFLAAASPSGSQVRGDSFPGRPTFTVVWSHRTGERVTTRVFVVAVGADLRIASVDYYEIDTV